MDALLEKPSRAVQMNTRLDALLKKQGDAALAAAGYSPSQAVRSLWTFAARNATQPKLIGRTLNALDEGDPKEETAEHARKLAAAQEGWHLLENTLEQYGIDASSLYETFEDFDEDALYEEALCERYQERRLL